MDWSERQDARLAVITELVSRAPSGHVGRTALMKFCYLLQTVRGVPLGYRFTLYSYGPFDSSVLSDLGTAESLGAVRSNVVYHSGGYGYRISKGDSSDMALRNGAEFWRSTAKTSTGCSIYSVLTAARNWNWRVRSFTWIAKLPGIGKASHLMSWYNV
jgi:hypothetical protein